MSINIILTGGSGFIGSRLLTMLTNNDFNVLALERKTPHINIGSHTRYKIVGDFCDILDWQEHLVGTDCIIHLANRAHLQKKSSAETYTKINRDATLNLALSAANLGIKRFIYISSIGVLGSSSSDTSVFNNNSKYDPQDNYSVSKMEAEIGLKKISKDFEMEIIVIRPPLVYGANAPGNFSRLLSLVDLDFPLPFKKMTEKKNMISLENLCDFITHCISVKLPSKFNAFVISDDSEWSTADLVTLISKYMENKNSIFNFPIALLYILASAIGKKNEIKKLEVPILVDGLQTARLLKWSPIQSPQDGIKEAVEYYLNNK